MKLLLGVGAFSVVSALAALASAQDLDPEAAVAHRAPPAHRGFQMAVRSGYSLPFGRVQGGPGGKMSDLVTGQVPLFIELGGKPIKPVFIGGYLGFAAGAVAGDMDDRCDTDDLDCAALSFRLGIEAQYHILPHEDLNPWVGYGIGVESLVIGIAKGDEDGSITHTGFEFARFMAGVDYRINRTIGLGPFADFTMSQYSRYRVDAPVIEDTEGSHDDKALHYWLTLGARVVFFP
jgi:hypothetical protein